MQEPVVYYSACTPCTVYNVVVKKVRLLSHLMGFLYFIGNHVYAGGHSHNLLVSRDYLVRNYH